MWTLLGCVRRADCAWYGGAAADKKRLPLQSVSSIVSLSAGVYAPCRWLLSMFALTRCSLLGLVGVPTISTNPAVGEEALSVSINLAVPVTPLEAPTSTDNHPKKPRHLSNVSSHALPSAVF